VRHKSIERPPAGRAVRVMLNGTEYDATFTVNGPTVTVHSLTLGIRVACIDDTPPEVRAKILLVEMVYRNEAAARNVPDCPNSEVGSGLLAGCAQDAANDPAHVHRAARLQHGPQDYGRVDVTDAGDLAYWCANFQCTGSALRAAVVAVGPSPMAVAAHLRADSKA
jgi:hypothetical protein